MKIKHIGNHHLDHLGFFHRIFCRSLKKLKMLNVENRRFVLMVMVLPWGTLKLYKNITYNKKNKSKTDDDDFQGAVLGGKNGT